MGLIYNHFIGAGTCFILSIIELFWLLVGLPNRIPYDLDDAGSHALDKDDTMTEMVRRARVSTFSRGLSPVTTACPLSVRSTMARGRSHASTRPTLTTTASVTFTVWGSQSATPW